jgi:sugar fermentation stimulation protein A
MYGPAERCKNVRRSKVSGLASKYPAFERSGGTKHLAELADMVHAGHRAVMAFSNQRSDVTRLSPARNVDVAYSEAFDAAVAAGVEVMEFRCKMTTTGIEGDNAVLIKG